MTYDNKNNIAWNKLNEKFHIVENVEKLGYFNISAKDIKMFREPRLMAKFDTYASQPTFFKENHLSILPVSRSNYIISNFNCYEKIQRLNNQKVEYVKFPNIYAAIDVNSITNENIAINCAYISGILQHFLDENQYDDLPIAPVISGRMSSGCFSYSIDNIRQGKKIIIDVQNSQLEIDGGFESNESLVLVEAKKFSPEDFLIRQLYYPYRLWSNKIKKNIRNLLLTYSNSIFTLYEYVFLSLENYNSISLKKSKKYSFEDIRISFKDITDILKEVKIMPEPVGVPFPQANDFNRIISLCEFLVEEKTIQDVTSYCSFTPRQSNYYLSACRYLGLVNKKKVANSSIYYLTKLGGDILKEKFKKRQLSFSKAILSHKVFNDVLRESIKSGKIISIEEIKKFINRLEISDVTKRRRTSTIYAWIEWIFELFADYNDEV